VRNEGWLNRNRFFIRCQGESFHKTICFVNGGQAGTEAAILAAELKILWVYPGTTSSDPRTNVSPLIVKETPVFRSQPVADGKRNKAPNSRQFTSIEIAREQVYTVQGQC
jgi:hypothetical protein